VNPWAVQLFYLELSIVRSFKKCSNIFLCLIAKVKNYDDNGRILSKLATDTWTIFERTRGMRMRWTIDNERSGWRKRSQNTWGVPAATCRREDRLGNYEMKTFE
jgi:hypothetical protein